MKIKSIIIIINLYFLLFVTAKTQMHHNKIDDVKSIKQLKKFLLSVDKKLAQFNISDSLVFKDKEYQHLSDSLKIKVYTKADFDHNGYTDMIVIGEEFGPSVLCIFDSGNNKFYIKRLTRRSFQDYIFPQVINDTSGSYINYYGFISPTSWHDTSTIKVVEHKKLIFKFGDFIEYNDPHMDYKIQKIDYNTTMCFGSCPVFTLTIDKNGNAKYVAKKFNKPNAKFEGIIDKNSMSEIIALLNYIDFAQLKDNYTVTWTDDQTCTLTVTYNSGKIKTIKDYGLIGTYGLDRLYQLLFKLRNNQDWKSED